MKKLLAIALCIADRIGVTREEIAQMEVALETYPPPKLSSIPGMTRIVPHLTTLSYVQGVQEKKKEEPQKEVQTKLPKIPKVKKNHTGKSGLDALFGGDEPETIPSHPIVEQPKRPGDVLRYRHRCPQCRHIQVNRQEHDDCRKCKVPMDSTRVVVTGRKNKRNGS